MGLEDRRIKSLTEVIHKSKILRKGSGPVMDIPQLIQLLTNMRRGIKQGAWPKAPLKKWVAEEYLATGRTFALPLYIINKS